jgi:hypothetical protein
MKFVLPDAAARAQTVLKVTAVAKRMFLIVCFMLVLLVIYKCRAGLSGEMDMLTVGLQRNRVDWILDADILLGAEDNGQLLQKVQ